ncbi:MAG TPA: hypothetical protein VJ691_10160 [Vicinamibacterales bacterium]|nr:hypothetical protein [Vicinamibacterales bacterium]
MQYRVGAVLAIVLMTPSAVEAQTRPSIEIAGGWIGFPDDGGTVDETLVGGAARWPVTSRFSIGPEVVYIRDRNHSHVVVTGNVTWDFRPGRAVQPFFVVGGGLFQTHEEFFDDAFTSREGAFTAGGGMRLRITERMSVGVDSRIGWEPHLRIGAIVSIPVGR